jgi:methylenetetrahydrofolate dehydrogenase (NADP+) / methenyltetrahydrofolate cyclohydrolase
LAQILSGREVSEFVLDRIKGLISDFNKKSGKTPGLAVVLVGEDPASQFYVASKKRACLRIGVNSFEHLLPKSVSESELITLIETLNDDDDVDGILLQLPLPKGLDSNKILDIISPDKDVDGFHPQNVGKLLLGLDTFKSCTPYGVCEILDYYKIDTVGKHVVIVGRSNIVGKPLAAMLVQRGYDATVTICHSKTKNMADITRSADILVAAVGVPELVTADMVKDGAVVIDVGINRVEDSSLEKGYKVVGDVAFDAVSEKASSITPVPGGVGLMTIAMLMTNTLHSFRTRNGLA